MQFQNLTYKELYDKFQWDIPKTYNIGYDIGYTLGYDIGYDLGCNMGYWAYACWLGRDLQKNVPPRKRTYTIILLRAIPTKPRPLSNAHYNLQRAFCFALANVCSSMYTNKCNSTCVNLFTKSA